MAASRTPDEPRTADRILDVAERLVQTRGFNRFSYADIAAELGITTASLHYHFPSKAQLGRSLIIRYTERFSGSLTRIDHDLPDARAKLEAYTRLYADVVRNERMCLCGILATEYETLPTPMRERGHQLLRRKREMARRGAHPGHGRQNADLHRIRGSNRPDHPRHTRGRHARCSSLQRCDEIRHDHTAACGQSDRMTICSAKARVRRAPRRCQKGAAAFAGSSHATEVALSA